MYSLAVIILPAWAIGFAFSRFNHSKSQLYAIVGAVTFMFYSLQLNIGLRSGPIILFSSEGHGLNWFDFSCVIDGFSGIVILLMSIFLVLISLTRQKNSKESQMRRFFQLFIIVWSAVLGLIVRDFFLFVIIFELVFLQYVLFVAIGTKSSNKVLSIKKILSFYSVGFVCNFTALLLLKYETMDQISFLTVDNLRQSVIPSSNIIFWMLIFSFLIRLGVFPFHGWVVRIFKESDPKSSVVFASTIGLMSYVAFFKFIAPSFVQNSQIYSDVICYYCLAGAFVSLLSSWYYKDVMKKLAFLLCAVISISVASVFSLNNYARLGGSIILFVGLVMVAIVMILLSEDEEQESRVKNQSKKLLWIVLASVLGFPGLLIFAGELLFVYGMTSKGIWITAGSGMLLAVMSAGILVYIKLLIRKEERGLRVVSKNAIAAITLIGAIFLGMGFFPQLIVKNYWLENKMRYEVLSHE